MDKVDLMFSKSDLCVLLNRKLSMHQAEFVVEDFTLEWLARIWDSLDVQKQTDILVAIPEIGAMLLMVKGGRITPDHFRETINSNVYKRFFPVNRGKSISALRRWLRNAPM